MYRDKKIQANGKFGFIRKDTGWATNCPDIGSLLTKTCDGKREHVSLENGVAARAAFYCIGLVRAVLRGLAKACRRNEASQVALDFGYTCKPCAPGKSSGGITEDIRSLLPIITRIMSLKNQDVRSVNLPDHNPRNTVAR